MITKLKRKFILIIMAIISIILFGAFFLYTFDLIHRQSTEIDYALNYAVYNYDKSYDLKFDSGKSEIERPLNLITFTMLVNQDHSLIAMYSPRYSISTDIANSLIQQTNQEQGYIRSYKLMYKKIRNPTGGYTIGFLDISEIINNSKEALIRTALSGAILWLLFLALSFLLSSWAVKPIENSWNKQKQFLQDASHELKTPLTVIIANTDLILSKKDVKPEYRAMLEATQTESRRMKKLVETLLTIAKNDDVRHSIQKQICNLSDIAWDCILSMEPIAYEHHQFMNSDIDDGIFVQGHPDQLKELILILLDNATKYTPKKKNITFKLKKIGTECQISVHNEGSYITAEDQSKIFDRFYRCDPSRQFKGGSGLGLAIAKQIADEHGIRLNVSSSKENGTSFFATLPIQQVNETNL